MAVKVKWRKAKTLGTQKMFFRLRENMDTTERDVGCR